MRTGLGNKAYTIVEALIFLAVSGVLFAAVATSISGQQTRAQFNQGVRDFESRLLDLANDVSTGYYQSNNNFGCTSNPADVEVSWVASKERGTNNGCILAGQALQFTLNSPNFIVHPLAGKQLTRVGVDTREVTSLSEANPKVVTASSQTERINYGLTVGRVTYNNGSVVNAGGLAFVITFGGYSPSTGELNSGDIHANLVPLVDASPAGIDAVNWGTVIQNPSGGMTVCLQDGSGPMARHAEIRLGGNGRQLDTDAIFGNGNCP